MNAIRDSTTPTSWASLRELVNYIVAVHHGYLRLTLPLLESLTDRIARDATMPPSLKDRLQRQFVALADLLEVHIAKQECWIFPKICQLREPVGETAWACQCGDSLEELMDRSVRESQDAMAMLDRVHGCLRGAAPAAKGLVMAQLVKDVQELRENLVHHIHLETDILFPCVRELLECQRILV